jgi:glycosyltransferase involved in cell wall biosynthesis
MPDLPELPPIAMAPISVVLPAHNAEADVEDAVRGWVTYLDGLARPYHIYLVDDGSADRTAERAEVLADRHSRLQVLRHPSHRGFGAALRTALEAARDPLLVYCPCDRQYQPSDLKLLLKEIDRVDLVNGGRSGTPMPSWLRVVGHIYRGVVRLLLGIPLEPLPIWRGWKADVGARLIQLLFGVRLGDPGSAFKLFRRSIFPRIPIQSDGAFVHVEVLAKANFLGCLMTEVPVAHRPAGSEPQPIWADARSVFSHPDFGPAVLPDEKAAAEASA